MLCMSYLKTSTYHDSKIEFVKLGKILENEFGVVILKYVTLWRAIKSFKGSKRPAQTPK